MITEEISTNFLRSFGFAGFIGVTDLGAASQTTGQIRMFNASSGLATTVQSGNATAAITYTLPTAGPAANNYLLASSTTGTLSWLNAAGTYAPIGSAFVTIGNDATLTGERSLTGTTNQVVVTDNGVNSTVVLSTPQNTHTAASPTFTGLTLSGLTASSFIFSNATSVVTSTAAPTNGQLLIGSTGANPAVAALTGTANQVTVTNGAGTITLATPQNIDTAATPTFSTLTLSGGAPATPTANKLYTDNICKAWIRFNGTGTPAITDQFNVSSITDNGVGDFTLNFATAMANTSYTAVGTGGEKTVQWGLVLFSATTPFQTGSLRIITQNPSDVTVDTVYVCVVVFGDQ